MRPDALAAMVAADLAAGILPCAIVATTGTTATTAIDPVARHRRGRPAPRHLAARGRGHGRQCDDPARVPLDVGRRRGGGQLVINAHKWLGVPFDCSLYYVRDPEHLVRVMSTNPSFLQSSVDGQVRNLRDWGIPLGRRFRALKLWFIIREQGVAGLQARLRRDMANAPRAGRRGGRDARAGRWSRRSPLQTVCVRHEPPGWRARRSTRTRAAGRRR